MASDVEKYAEFNLKSVLADRRAYATGLRLSSVCTEYIVAKRCVLERKLLSTTCSKS